MRIPPQLLVMRLAFDTLNIIAECLILSFFSWQRNNSEASGEEPLPYIYRKSNDMIGSDT